MVARRTQGQDAMPRIMAPGTVPQGGERQGKRAQVEHRAGIIARMEIMCARGRTTGVARVATSDEGQSSLFDFHRTRLSHPQI